MLLSHNEILELLEDGVIEGADPDHVNSASLDIRLDKVIMCEDRQPGFKQVIDLANKKTINMLEYDLTSMSQHNDYILHPGEFILASSVEIFNLPNTISAEYKLKSSMARSGLEHLNAGWCDAGWHGSRLTLELVNITKHHHLRIEVGMKIGQMVFFKHAAVPDEKSYAARGRYNQDVKVAGSKGIQ